MLNEYDKLFVNDEEWKECVKKFANKSVDMIVILSKFVLPFKQEINKDVMYQPSF